MTEETAGVQHDLRPALKVVDATLRDGGLVNDFRFSDDFVRALYAADLAAGVDYMEVGYKADRDIFDETKFGKWKFCRDEDVAAVLGGRTSRMKLACMADVGRCNFRRDICAKGNSPIDMYRIATYADTIPEAIGMLEYCDRLGYETTVNIMAISRESVETVQRTLDMLGGVSATFTPNEKFDLAEWFQGEDAKDEAKRAREAELAKDKKHVEKANKDTVFRCHIALVDEPEDFGDDVPLTDSDFIIGVRPEFIKISDTGAVEGEIYSAMPTGMETTVRIKIVNYLLTGVVFGGVLYRIGEKVRLDFDGSGVVLFSRRNGRLISLGSVELS